MSSDFLRSVHALPWSSSDDQFRKIVCPHDVFDVVTSATARSVHGPFICYYTSEPARLLKPSLFILTLGLLHTVSEDTANLFNTYIVFDTPDQYGTAVWEWPDKTDGRNLTLSKHGWEFCLCFKSKAHGIHNYRVVLVRKAGTTFSNSNAQRVVEFVKDRPADVSDAIFNTVKLAGDFAKNVAQGACSAAVGRAFRHGAIPLASAGAPAQERWDLAEQLGADGRQLFGDFLPIRF